MRKENFFAISDVRDFSLANQEPDPILATPKDVCYFADIQERLNHLIDPQGGALLVISQKNPIHCFYRRRVNKGVSLHWIPKSFLILKRVLG